MATTIDNFLLAESGRFAQDILQKTLRVSPWMSLVEEGPFPEGMGYSISITQFGRALPATAWSEGGAITNPAYDSTYWTDIGTGGLDSGSTNNCTPPLLTVKQGTGKVSFNLQHLALESERFCATDLLLVFDGARQLAAIKKNLSDVTKFVLTEKFRRDYTYWCDNKQVVTLSPSTMATVTSGASGVSGADTFNITGSALKTAGAGTPGVLNQANLQDWYYRLCLNGAGEGALTQDNGAPVFGLICSMEASRRLKVEANYRDDYRWSSKADQLLESIGATTPPVLGYQHIIDITPPRWNYTAGAWVKVEPYVITVLAGGAGYAIKENPAYLTATWEDSIIFHKSVMKETYPGAMGNTSGTGFTPVNYRGVWSWRNILNETTNPDGTIGFFRGVFMLGAMPEYQNYGVVIRHSRCGPGTVYAACA